MKPQELWTSDDSAHQTRLRRRERLAAEIKRQWDYQAWLQYWARGQVGR